MVAGTMRMQAHQAPGGRGQHPAGEQEPGGPVVTGAAADVRVQAARDRLAEVPSDDVLVRLDARSLAAVAGKAVMAAQLLDACIRDSGRAGHRDGGVPVVLALDGGVQQLRGHHRLCEDHGASREAADSYDRLRWQLEAQAPAVHPAERQAGWEAAS